MHVTCGVPTKGRYGLLALTLMSLAMQSYTNFNLIVVDDTDKPLDIREVPECRAALDVLNHRGIEWEVVYGQKAGQHLSHQLVQDKAKGEWVWRIDDDCHAEPHTLRRLVQTAELCYNLGAVGGLILPPNPQSLPEDAASKIDDLDRFNLQWGFHRDSILKEVDHLHCSFLYRKGIARYEEFLSPASHREETLFTHEIKRAGYRLMVDPTAITWHFRASHGGIRSHDDPDFWHKDELLFQDKLREWGGHKHIVSVGGRGDEVVLKSVLPELKAKYDRVTIACCSPEIFDGEDCISVAEAEQRLGNLDRFSPYIWMHKQNWKASLQDAYRGLYSLS